MLDKNLKIIHISSAKIRENYSKKDVNDIINSIRTASESVVEATAVGKATLQINNENPGNYTFNLSDNSTSVDISVELPSSDLSGLVTAINSTALNITATLSGSTKPSPPKKGFEKVSRCVKVDTAFALPITLGKLFNK